MKPLICLAFLVLLAGVWPAELPADGVAAPEISEQLRTRLETAFLTDSLSVGEESLYARNTLRRVYVTRSFTPLWVGDAGARPQAERFIRWMETEPFRHGLDARLYHLEAIQALEGIDSPGALVDLELALSDAFLMLGAHLLAGRLDPTTFDPEWHGTRRQGDVSAMLERAIRLENPGKVLDQLLPDYPEYVAVTDALADLRQTANEGGWPQVPPGPTLHKDDVDDRVPAIAARLGLPGYGRKTEFDENLETAVMVFQGRHGLNQDGVIGPATLRALNVPVESRIDQVLVNLERWRWLPESLGERFVLVNIANFSLHAFEANERVLGMRVVVGAPYRRTPVFSEMIRYMVINPAWEVPHRIAVQDKLPLIQADVSYLRDNNYLVYQGWGAEERLVDPASVDWAALTRGNFPYRLRQQPGPKNALGRIKFMFPNEFSVYLHDTPARELFGKESRVFSSGCIRVEHPLELAEWLLGDDPDWTATSLEQSLAGPPEQTVRLDVPVPVHIQYWTAWVDSEGNLQLREDVYGRDARVLASLALDPPSYQDTDLQ